MRGDQGRSIPSILYSNRRQEMAKHESIDLAPVIRRVKRIRLVNPSNGSQTVVIEPSDPIQTPLT